MLQNKLQVFCCPFYLTFTALFINMSPGTKLRSRGKRQKTGSNRNNNGNRSEPSGILGRGKKPPFSLPRLPLDRRFTGGFFFSSTPIFSSFSHNAEPGPRLIHTRILKFKRQLTFALFAAVGSKGHGLLFCDWWVSIRFVCFCVTRFVACDRIVNCGFLNFRVRVFLKRAVRNSL